MRREAEIPTSHSFSIQTQNTYSCFTSLQSNSCLRAQSEVNLSCRLCLNMSTTEYLQELNTKMDWTENLISMVKERPPIYKSEMPEHGNRQLIERLWHEIFEKMVPGWKNMTVVEKTFRGKEIHSKWKNIRTCFRRELSKQRQESADQSSKRRRKYLYFNQLLFLLPSMKDLVTMDACSPSNEEESSEGTCDPLDTEETTSTQTFEFNYKTPYTARTLPEVEPEQPRVNTVSENRKMITEEPSLTSTAKDNKEEAIDEDKYFLLSLLPTLKKLNDDQKFEVKIEFLSTLKRLNEAKQSKVSQVPQIQRVRSLKKRRRVTSSSRIHIKSFSQGPDTSSVSQTGSNRISVRSFSPVPESSVTQTAQSEEFDGISKIEIDYT